ncbi:diguanylate cyclase [Novosphingobium resinovorum]
MTDPLTGACNRRAFDDALAALVASPPIGAEAGCLAVFDLDHFKRINDEYGHAAATRCWFVSWPSSGPRCVRGSRRAAWRRGIRGVAGRAFS